MTEQHEQAWKRMQITKKETIEWFRKSRFGMFIHWGLYSIPGGIWKGKKMEDGRRPRVAEWIMHAHNIPRDEYASLAREFDPVEFNARQWVSLAKNAGMKYIVITSKHHDGFALFDSATSDYSVVKASPYGKDLIKALHEECKKQGIEFGLYYSHSIDWMDGGDGGQKDYSKSSGQNIGLHAYNDWDPSPVSYDDYIEKKALPQVRELLEQYDNLKLIWFDVAYHIPEKYSFAFYKLVHDLSPETIISQRIGNGFGDYDIPGDNIIPENAHAHSRAWETVGTLNNSWGYKSYDHDWKQPKELVFWIVDIASKGGNYMLNIGPKGDGSIPQESVTILESIGRWLKTNGDAIYGTMPWDIQQEGNTAIPMTGTNSREDKGFKALFTPEDFWFTSKDDAVYACCLAPDVGNSILIKSFKDRKVKSVRYLGSGSALPFELTGQGLRIDTTGVQGGEIGYVFEIRQ